MDRERRAWHDMWARVRCKPDAGAGHWKYYGARGIKCCARWRSFDKFLADVGRAPSPKHEIDRIKNDKGYYPGNVRWATRSEQNRNRRKRPWKGVRVADRISKPHQHDEHAIWRQARAAGFRTGTIEARLRRGWSLDKALSTPVR